MRYIVQIRTSIRGERVYPGQAVELTPDVHVNSLVESGALVQQPEIVTQEHGDTYREVAVTKKSPRGRGGRPRKNQPKD